MQIFGEASLRDYLDKRIASMNHEIEAEPANRLLNTNEAQYVEYLVEAYAIEPLVFSWDGMHLTDSEELIPADACPNLFPVRPGQSYLRQVITYHIPFAGSAELLRCRPSTHLLWSQDVNVSSGAISFSVINWRDEPEEIKRAADQVLSSIQRQEAHVHDEVARFNEGLLSLALSSLRGRRQKLLQRSSLLESLGVPVSRSPHTPETFAIPTVRKKVVVKPASMDAAYVPEPTLDVQLYREILRLCRDTGIEMERHPRIYSDKDEETLRDHFIMVLSPHFDSVTGETFNKNGRTDILIRHESANVFVAECKFWSGKKGLSKTVDQVLGYLTWRDSKAAVILFVRNKKLGPVLDQVDPSVSSHQCYVSTATSDGEAWRNYNFHLPNDFTRGVRLAVLCFHLPPTL